MNTIEKMYQLKKDNKVLKEGTHFECLLFLQKYQSQSCDWATKYEGYKIELI
jgi:hypothetical protein